MPKFFEDFLNRLHSQVLGLVDIGVLRIIDDALFWRRWDFQKGNGALMRRRLRSGERNWVCLVGGSDGFTELHQSSIGSMAGHDIQTEAPLNCGLANSFRPRIEVGNTL